MNSKFKLFKGLFLVSLFLLSATNSPVVSGTQEMVTGLKFFVYTGHGASHYDAEFLNANYTDAGNNVTLSYDPADLLTLQANNYDAVFIPGGENFTTAEIAEISTWFGLGNKLLWYAGDSDYKGYFNASLANPVLAAIGTALRFDAGAVDDLQSNDGGSYRVVANETGVSSTLTDYVTGDWYNSTFHGPTSFNYWDGSAFKDLRNATLGTTPLVGVDIIVNSSAAATVLDQDVTLRDVDFYGYSEVTGNYPLMVSDMIGTSLFVGSGETIFMDYKNMYGYVYEKAGTPHQGAKLTDNMLMYFFTVQANIASTVIVAPRTVTATETETETETVVSNNTVTEVSNNTVVSTVTEDAVTVTASKTEIFTETKTETPLPLAGPLLALFSAVTVVVLVRRRK